MYYVMHNSITRGQKADNKFLSKHFYKWAATYVLQEAIRQANKSTV